MRENGRIVSKAVIIAVGVNGDGRHLLRRRLRGLYRPPAHARHPPPRDPNHQSPRASLPRGAAAPEDHPQRLRPFGEQPVLKFMVGAMSRAADRSRATKFTHFGRRQMRRPRSEIPSSDQHAIPPVSAAEPIRLIQQSLDLTAASLPLLQPCPPRPPPPDLTRAAPTCPGRPRAGRIARARTDAAASLHRRPHPSAQPRPPQCHRRRSQITKYSGTTAVYGQTLAREVAALVVDDQQSMRAMARLVLKEIGSLTSP